MKGLILGKLVMEVLGFFRSVMNGFIQLVHGLIQSVFFVFFISDLDKSFQKAFQKYLEIRGIKSSITKFLQEYMKNKDYREYLLWLKNLKGFIEE